MLVVYFSSMSKLWSEHITFKLLHYNFFFNHLEFSLATATQTFKWVKITFICTILIKIYANIAIVRAHFRNFWLCKAFFSRIWHAVVPTQFGNADFKSAPCQAIFCVFPTQNSKTKWPPKLVKMSQLYITAWLTMNIKTLFQCIKTHPSNILEVP